MLYLPLAAVTAYHGELTTAMIALMAEWILQKTRTMPVCLKITLFDVRGRYSPTSKGWPLKFEKALWKMRSRLGNSTVPPMAMATTCGTNSLSFCFISTFLGGG